MHSLASVVIIHRRTQVINWILIDCTGINKNEMASYPGSKTIELAKKDIDECFINDDN